MSKKIREWYDIVLVTPLLFYPPGFIYLYSISDSGSFDLLIAGFFNVCAIGTIIYVLRAYVTVGKKTSIALSVFLAIILVFLLSGIIKDTLSIPIKAAEASVVLFMLVLFWCMMHDSIRKYRILQVFAALFVLNTLVLFGLMVHVIQSNFVGEPSLFPVTILTLLFFYLLYAPLYVLYRLTKLDGAIMKHIYL